MQASRTGTMLLTNFLSLFTLSNLNKGFEKAHKLNPKLHLKKFSSRKEPYNNVIPYRSKTTRSVAVSALLFKILSRFRIFCSSSLGSHFPFRMEAVSPRIRGQHGKASQT